LYFLLVISAALILTCIVSLLWQPFQRAIHKVRQIWTDIKKLRVTVGLFKFRFYSEPVQSYEHAGTRFPVIADEKSEKSKRMMQHITYAESAISAGNVNMWLDCRVEQVYWVALARPTFSYVVVQLEVSSRFLYDLLFTNLEQIDSSLIIKGTKEAEDIKVANRTVLVESQPQWGNPEEAIEFRGVTPIQALWRNVLYFRFNMDVTITNLLEAYHKGEKELRLELQLDWKLKTAHNGREVVYYRKIITKCPITWEDD
jgi:hypothetical protein